jgi:hypothetical protein
MTGKMGLLVNAVGNFDGSAFVPSKNQRNARAAMELARAVNGGSFSKSAIARAALLTSIGLGSDVPPSLATHEWWCDQTRTTRRLFRLKPRRFRRSTMPAICLRIFVYLNAN